MKIEVVAEKKNELLRRRELVLGVSDYKNTPSRKDMVAEVSARMGGKEACIVVETLRQEYGARRGTARVRIYDSEEALKNAEPKQKEKKQNETASEKK
ncbi:hypothetical protein HYS54_04425 [Candidatus Micrarchaeota archaeon]|nr:hypothetical protein [Candidatus Micrarchaeota archaeon]